MSTPKAPDSDGADDLALRARRGSLPPEGRRAFERALEAEPAVRVAFQVGRDFDDEQRVRAGDDELILRASAAALARPRGRALGKRRVFVLFAAAMLVVASAAAATSVWVAARATDQAPAHVAATRSPSAKLARGAARTPAAATLAPASEAPPAADAADTADTADTARPRPAPPSHRPSNETSPAERTAASLFRDASSARRAGDLGGARSLYLELQAAFPDSNEARVSRVSLGKLLLGSGHAREAELEFGNYLAHGGGNLTEEALVGRADALARLGRAGEERRVWQELLQTQPSSVYAPRARQRLGELGADE